jgi:bifunctional non-homologous end joining protein LigD
MTQLLHKPSSGIAFNEHFVGDGDIFYQEACQLGCEGIVSKRLGSTYRSGRKPRRSISSRSKTQSTAVWL